MHLDVRHPFIRAIIGGDIQALRAMEIEPEWLVSFIKLNPDYMGFGVTPLMIAAGSLESNVETVDFLLEKGADPKVVSHFSSSALGYAVEGLPQIFFDRRLDRDSAEAFLAGGDLARIERLLEVGGDVKEKAANGATLVSFAARRGKVEWLKLLLDHGAPLYPDTESAEPRDEWWKRAPINGPDVKTSLFYQWQMPLHSAAESGSVECCELLLGLGVPVDESDSNGATPLTYAGTPEVARYLIEKGADINGTGSPFSTVLEEHLENERYDVARALLEAGAQIEKSHWGTNMVHGFAGVHMDLNALKLLVEFGADLHAPYYNNGTILHNACWQGEGNAGRSSEVVRETLEYLIEQGIPIDAKNERGETALHEAVHGDWGSPTATEVLLENGADPNVANCEGVTPLMSAASRGENACVALLLQYGADADLKDPSGDRALEYASRHLDSWRGIARDSEADYQREALEEAESTFATLLQATSP